MAILLANTLPGRSYSWEMFLQEHNAPTYAFKMGTSMHPSARHSNLAWHDAVPSLARRSQKHDKNSHALPLGPDV